MEDCRARLVPGRHRRPFQFLLSQVALLLAFAAASVAQLNQGAIEGLVTDQQGKDIANVAVTITSIERNAVIATHTNQTGYYRAGDLTPGKYTLRFESAGFNTTELRELEVGAGSLVRADVELRVGATLQSIEVQSDAQRVDAAASNFSTTLDTHTIQELPLQGRDMMQSVYLFPGVNSNTGPPGTNFGFNGQFGSFPDPTNVLGSNLSVNGGQGGANAWYIDGNLNLSTYNENAVINPSPEVSSHDLI